MSHQVANRLYDLLPAVYRIRDYGEKEPLRTLMAIIEREFLALEADIEGLYENWFIETCDEWVVSYIGDLLGVRALHPGIPGIYSQRGFIANTLAYRRRKGTALVLEQLARDVTGWPARVLEFNRILAINQSLNHIRPDAPSTPDLRNTDNLEKLDGPFDRIAHGVDIRKIQSNRGKYNIPNVGLFLWRVQSYSVSRNPAHRVSTGLYTFHPLGYPTELFNIPKTETDIAHLAEEVNVPMPIRPKALHLDLADFRERYAVDSGIRPESAYYGSNGSLAVYLNGSDQPVPPNNIISMDLGGWNRPEAGQPGGEGGNQGCLVGVDVRLGRLAFPENFDPVRVDVSYGYGFGADIGGGPYNRHHTLTDSGLKAWEPTAMQTEEESPGWLREALDGWEEALDAREEARAQDMEGDPNLLRGIIRINNNAVFVDELKIVLKKDSWLTIEAGDEMQPNIRPATNITIELPKEGSATLTLNGLRIENGIEILCDPEGKSQLALNIIHCTLVPGGCLNEQGRPQKPKEPSLFVTEKAEELDVTISNSIVGPIHLPPDGGRLTIRDSIVDANPLEVSDEVFAIASDSSGLPGPPLILERCTVLGGVQVRELSKASEVIFTDQVYVERVQRGCIRYSYLQESSRVPRRYRCQPNHALSTIVNQAERDQILGRLRPGFNDIKYGNPDYAQLSPACAEEIRTGAEDGSEMGAFCHLKQPQREANLRNSLGEYLPFGLESGIFFVT